MKKDWQIKKLKDICDKGSSNVNMKDLDKLDGEFPIYGASGFIKNVNFYHQEKEYIGIIKDGSGIGRTMLLPPKSSVIGTIQYILPKENNSIHFINYALQSLDLAKYKQGAAIPHIYFRDYGETELVVPPLAEQERIVKILDQKFSQIDAVKQNAQANLNNAKALFQSELEKAFSDTSWEKKQIKDVCDSCLGKMLDKNKNKGIPKPYLANSNVRWGSFDLENLSLMKFEENENERYGLKYGDLIVCEGGEPGRCAIWTDEMPNMKIQKALHRVRCHENLYNYFLYYYFVYLNASDKLEEHFTGTTIKHLPGEKLKNIEIQLPPLEEQKRIVAHLDSLSEKVHQMEEIYTKQLADCDELKQSLLQKAFEG